jgi:hypothetical protein
MPKAELTDQSFELLSLFSLREVGHFQYSADVILNTELPKYGRFLRKIANTHLRSLVHRELGNILVIDKDPAFVRLDQAHGHIESSGLPGTVRSKQTNYFSLLYLDGNVINHRTGTIALYKILCMNDDAQKIFAKSKGKPLFAGFDKLLLYFVNCILSLQPHESYRTFEGGAGHPGFI